MNCPVCDNVSLKEVEKENVLIDICPNCKGVWLDRGELEKITQGLREDQQYTDQSSKYDDRKYRDDRDYPRNDYDKRHDSRYQKDSHNPKKRRKKSMMDVLGNLFE